MITSTVGTATIRHTVEILTWRELAAEQYANVSAHVNAHLRAHLPTITPRRITFIPRGTVAA
jgi:hypothetical protein